MSESSAVECPVCGEPFDPTAAGGWCTNSECGEWRYDDAGIGADSTGTDDDEDDQFDSETDQFDSETDQFGSETDQFGSETDQFGSETDQFGSELEQSPSDAAESTEAEFGLDTDTTETLEEDVTPSTEGTLEIDDTPDETSESDEGDAGDGERLEEACPECGKALASDANFCPSCGSDVADSAEESIACPECGVDMEPDANFCPSCGSSVDAGQESLRECPECGTEIEDDDRFCVSCGEDLDAHRSGSAATDSVDETVRAARGTAPESLVLVVRGEEISVSDGDTVGRELRRIITETGGDEEQAVRVHREHVQFVRELGQFFLIDLAENPTRLNGDSLEKGDRKPVAPGDEIELSGIVDIAVRGP